MARISTSSTGGNVNIQDTDGNPIYSSNGALDVNVVSTGAGGSAISAYNEITNVAMGSSATVLTYTVPTGKTLSISRVLMSSDSIGIIEVDIAGSANAKGRFSYTAYNIDFEYDGYQIASGTVITVVATNSSLQGVASFNATLQGTLA
jgi:hypothetical protein